jgi:hypothetical protein
VCVQPLCAQASGDDLVIRLAGATMTEVGHYEVTSGSTIFVNLNSSPGEIVWLFAVGSDPSGAPDPSHVMTLLTDRTATGHTTASFWASPILEGQIFYLQAVARSGTGRRRVSEMLAIAIPGRIICYPSPQGTPRDPEGVPAVQLRVGGAIMVGPYHYVVVAGATVTIAADAKPGDWVAIMASPVDPITGEADHSVVLKLVAQKTHDGMVVTDVDIPAGLDGRRFEVRAVAIGSDGRISESTTLLFDVGLRVMQ